MGSKDSVTLQDAITRYFSGLKVKKDQTLAQQALFRLAQWFGPNRAVSGLRPYEIEGYGEQIEGIGTAPQAAERIKAVRSFLTFATKSGLVEQNLASHLRNRKTRGRSRSGTQADGPHKIELTPEGHAQLLERLEKLKAERAPIASAIQQAAADKDVRENAPLEAAREQLGHVESRIAEIEETLRVATVVDPSKKPRGRAVAVGASVVMRETGTGKKTTYTLVNAYEANPLEGRISNESPVGRALIGRAAGEEVEVDSPRGKLRYRILKVTF